VGIHTWQRTDPPPPIRRPSTSISSSLSACSPVQHSKAYHRTYSLRQPDANCCSASEPVPLSKLNGPDHHTEPITRPVLFHNTTARPLGPKTEDGTIAASSIITTTMESTSPAHGSTTSETPASANRTSGHRCFVCSRTYERADHLNRHLKSRKCPSILLKRPDVACVLPSGQHMLMRLL
jgi:hypothetical protein